MSLDALGSLVVSLTAETAQFRSEMERSAYVANTHMGQIVRSANEVAQGIQGLESRMASFGINLRLLGVSLGGAGLVELVRQSIDAQMEMADLAERTSQTVEAISALRPAAAATGTEMGGVASALEKFAKNMAEARTGSGDAARALAALGFSSQDAARFLREPAQGMLEVTQRMNTFRDSGEKTVANLAMFGKSAGDLAPFMRELGQQTQLTATMTTAQAEAADILQKQLGLLKLQSGEVARTIATDLIPVMNDFITGLVRAQQETGTAGDAVRRLSTEGKITEWAREAAMGLAIVIETFQVLSRVVQAFAGSIKVVFADIEAAAVIANNLRPGALIDPGEIKAALDKRQAALDSANAKWKEAWDFNSRAIEDALKAQFALSDSLKADANQPAQDFEARSRGVLNFAAATNEAAKQAKSFLDRLREQVETFGMSQTALLSYQAAMAGVGKEAEPLIRRLADLNVAQQAMTERAKELEDARKRGMEMGAAIQRQAEDAARTALGLVESLQAENATYGQGEFAKRRYAIAAQIAKEADLGHTEAVEALTRALDELNRLESTDVGAKSAEAAKRAWQDTADTIQRSLEDAFMGAFDKSKNWGQQLRDWLEQAFRSLVLRPLLQPVSGAIASVFSAGAAASPLGGGGGLASNFGMLGDLGSLIGAGGVNLSGSLAGGISSLFGASNFTAALAGDAFMPALAASGAGLGSTLGAGLAAAIPWIGPLLIGGTLISSFLDSKRGGPKGGGFAASGPWAGGRFFTPDSADSSLAQQAAAIQASYEAALQGLGGSGSAAFGIGFDVDPEGTANSRLSAGVQVGGRTVYQFQDRDEGRGTEGIEADLKVETQRMLLAALQASDMPKAIAQILNSVSASTGSESQVQRVMQYANSYKAIGDLLARNPMEDAIKGLTQSSQGAYGAFMATGEAMRSVIASFKGTTEQTQALQAASVAYYQTQVALLQQIATVRQGITTMFGDTARSLQLAALDKEGQYDFLREEADVLKGRLATAIDPETIRQLTQLINSDINQAFGLADPEQRKAMLDDYLAFTKEVDTLAQGRLAEIEATTQKTATTALEGAQKTIADAAAALKQSSDLINGAADKLNAAADLTVNVRFVANVPGNAETNVS